MPYLISLFVQMASLRQSHFNPIENAFSKLNALLRAKAERTVSAMWDAVAAVLDLFTPDCHRGIGTPVLGCEGHDGEHPIRHR